MKALTIILAGYIANTTGFPVQGSPAATSAGNPGSRPETEVPQIITWSSDRLFITEQDSSFSGRHTPMLPDAAGIHCDTALPPRYQVIVMPPEGIGSSTTRNRVSQVSREAVPHSIFSGLDEDEITWLRYGGARDRLSAPHGGSAVSKAAQVITIEPLNTIQRRPPDSTVLRKHAFTCRKPEAIGFKRFSPRTVLSTWAERWMTETSEIPVVVVQYEF
jgi:hypothetical protein